MNKGLGIERIGGGGNGRQVSHNAIIWAKQLESEKKTIEELKFVRSYKDTRKQQMQEKHFDLPSFP